MAYSAYDRATLRAELADRWEHVPFWTDDDANSAINEALHLWNQLTGVWKGRLVIPTTANGPWYALPAALSLGARVVYHGEPLEPSTLFDLDHGYPAWESAIGTPRVWAPKGLYLIAVAPNDGGGSSLLIDGITETPVLLTDADYLDLDAAQVSTLVGCALHLAAFKLGGEIFQGTLSFWKAFILAAGDQNHRFKDHHVYRQILGLNREQLPGVTAQRQAAKQEAGA